MKRCSTTCRGEAWSFLFGVLPPPGSGRAKSNERASGHQYHCGVARRGIRCRRMRKINARDLAPMIGS